MRTEEWRSEDRKLVREVREMVESFFADDGAYDFDAPGALDIAELPDIEDVLGGYNVLQWASDLLAAEIKEYLGQIE